MKKKIADAFIKSITHFPENILFQSICTIILILPLITTIGQFSSTGYFTKSVPFLLFYWPGSTHEVKITLYVWIGMSLIFISYLAGTAYLFQKRTLGKIILVVILVFVCSNLLRAFLTSMFGWHESPLPNLAGKANSVIFSLWHNPIWEEIVFRGIPLVILILVEKYIFKKRKLAGVLIYCTVPSIICGLYHIPGHGIIRFFDTLIIGSAFAWLALKYTFLAPVVMHNIADAMLVLNLNKIPTIQPGEIEWILQYGRTLNTFSSLFALALFLLIPTLLIVYFIRYYKNNQTHTSTQSSSTGL
jgi:hypothetical protein